jgi:gliding motility-associated-like protein
LSGDSNGTWQDVDLSGAVGLFSNLNFNNVTAGDYRFRYTTNSAIAPCPETTYMVKVTVLDCTCPDVWFLMANPLCNAGDILDLTILGNPAETGSWTMLETPVGSNPAMLNGALFTTTDGDPGDYVFQFSLQDQPPPGCPLDFQIVVHVDQEVNAGVAVQPAEYCFDENVLVNLSDLITGEDAIGSWWETSSQPSQNGGFNALNGSFQIANQNPGVYTFEYALLSNGACPADATQVTVVIDPVPVVMIDDADDLDCDHLTQTLNASGSSSGFNFVIDWTGPGVVTDGNEVTLHPTIDKPGNYILTITNTLTTCANSASVIVTQNTSAPSDALLLSQDPSCFGDQNGLISIGQVIGGTPPFLFSFNNGAFNSNNFYSNLPGGDYVITLVDANGCKWDTLITLVQPSEITIDIGDDIELDLGENAYIQTLVNLSPNEIDTVIWSPPGIVECFDLLCLESTIQTFNPVLLTATLVDENGCKVSDKLSITVRKNRRVFIPTVFSPNGDGINDIFFISGATSQIVEIRKFVVFNRWGEQLYALLNFQPNDPSTGWDGTFKSEKINPGVFVYAAEVEFIDGVVEVYTGDVTVIR